VVWPDDSQTTEAALTLGAEHVPAGELTEMPVEESTAEPSAADNGGPDDGGTSTESTEEAEGAPLTRDGEARHALAQMNEALEVVERGDHGVFITEDVAAARAMVEPWLERMHLAQADASAKKAAKKAKTWPFAFAGLLALCTMVRSSPAGRSNASVWCCAYPYHGC
jgi:hypothetical protein